MNGVEEGRPATDDKRSALRIVLRILVVIIVAVGLAMGAIIIQAGRQAIFIAKRHKLENEFSQVQTAVLNYYTEYSEYPASPDNATLIKKLTGGSPQQIAFMSSRPSDENAEGELLDPWGTPLQLSVSADGVMSASSAGPDKVFGTPDDITANSNLARNRSDK